MKYYYIRDNLQILEEGKCKSFLEIPQNDQPNIVIREIYRVPDTNEAEFLHTYEKLISKIKREHKHMIRELLFGTDWPKSRLFEHQRP